MDTFESTQYLDLFFNMKAPLNKSLRDVELRHLMNAVVDRDRIISVAYPGSTPGASIVTPTATFWNPGVKAPAFDVNGVNKKLDAAGYKRGSDGIRTWGGVQMKFSVLINNALGGAGDRTFQILRDDFSKVGIQLVGKTMDSAAYHSALFGKNNSYTGWDMALGTDSALFDPGYDLSYFTCGSFGAYNFSGWCDKRFDKLYYKQASLTNPEERKPVVYEMQEYADKVLPAITILYTATVDAYQPDWTGFGAGPFGSLSPLGKVTITGAHKIK